MNPRNKNNIVLITLVILVALALLTVLFFMPGEGLRAFLVGPTVSESTYDTDISPEVLFPEGTPNSEEAINTGNVVCTAFRYDIASNSCTEYNYLCADVNLEERLSKEDCEAQRMK